jgi:hypothetical protein
MKSRIAGPGPYVRPFPAVEEVFGEPLEMHRKHFLPLISIHGTLLSNDLNQWLHFVTPIEPLLELTPGYFTEEFHDDYNKDSQIAFRVKNGRYIFSGNWNYFAYESGVIYEQFGGTMKKEIDADYRGRFKSYERARKRFATTGRLKDNPLLTQLGGDVCPGNWGTLEPLNKDGRPYRFIGEICAWGYCGHGGIQAILFFHDSVDKMARFYFDWT